MSIELESPVVVVPRHAHSPQVFVAHLGRMSLRNRPGAPRRTLYKVRVRDISLATVDAGARLAADGPAAGCPAAVYDAAAGKPVLHNTALRLTINYADPDPDCDADYQV